MSDTVVVTESPTTVTVNETTNAVTIVESDNTVTVTTVGIQGATGPTGATGATGATGPQGPSGVISVTAPITNSGTSTNANIGVATSNGLTTSGGSLVADFGSTSTTVAAGNRGLPTGGTTGQVLAKTDSADYATAWATPAMAHIKSQEITNGVSSVVVSDVFSVKYRNYLVVIDRAARTSPNNGQLLLTLGGIVTGYYFGGRSQSFSGAPFVHSASNTSSWFIGYTEQQPWGGQQLTSVTISAPYLTTRTTFTALSFGGEYNSTLGGTMLNETALTYFTLTVNAGSFVGGNIAVYGYAV